MSNATVAIATAQGDLLAWKPPAPGNQDGDLDIWKDGPRLNSLMMQTYKLMLPPIGERYGRWFSVEELEEALQRNWASIGARLRDMRKPKFGCPCDFEHIDKGGGQFQYRLVRRQALWPIAGVHYKAPANE